ncbi:MAG: hypothetical protein ACYS0D_10630 [Planctomycetota bacterium]
MSASGPGAYEVEDPAGASQAESRDARDFRAQARELRSQGYVLREQVRNRTMSARKAAREQIKAARARAHEMRRRAREHRMRAVKTMPPVKRESNPTPAAAAAMLVLVVAAAAGGLALLDHRRDQVVQMSMPMVSGYKADGNPLTLLLINDLPAMVDPAVQAEMAQFIAERRRLGYVIIDDDREAEVEIRKRLPSGRYDPVSPLLRHTLRRYDLEGVMQVSVEPGEDGSLVTNILVPDIEDEYDELPPVED